MLLCYRWKYTIMQDGWTADESGKPTPPEVIEVITGKILHNITLILLQVHVIINVITIIILFRYVLYGESRHQT